MRRGVGKDADRERQVKEERWEEERGVDADEESEEGDEELDDEDEVDEREGDAAQRAPESFVRGDRPGPTRERTRERAGTTMTRRRRSYPYPYPSPYAYPRGKEAPGCDVPGCRGCEAAGTPRLRPAFDFASGREREREGGWTVLEDDSEDG